MSWLRAIAVLAVVLASFGPPGSAMAVGVDAPANSTACISAFELVAATLVGASAETCPALHEGEWAARTAKTLQATYLFVPRGTAGAESAANRLRLQQQLASEQQVGEVLTQPRSMAGAGSARQIDDINRLVSQYGDDGADWAKVRSSSFTAADGTRFEVHAYRNVRTGETFELKTKFQ